MSLDFSDFATNFCGYTGNEVVRKDDCKLGLGIVSCVLTCVNGSCLLLDRKVLIHDGGAWSGGRPGLSNKNSLDKRSISLVSPGDHFHSRKRTLNFTATPCFLHTHSTYQKEPFTKLHTRMRKLYGIKYLPNSYLF